MSWHPWSVKVAAGALAAVALVGFASSPALADSANAYLSRTQTVGSTGCRITVSSWQNSAAYPGVYAGLSCSAAHAVYLYHEIDYANTAGGWTAYGDQGWNWMGTAANSWHEYTWSNCNMQQYGRITWRVLAWANIDGITYGPYSSWSGGWTACTRS